MATATPDITTQAQQLLLRATSSLKRYRVMAWVTGVMLLALCVEMTLKYLVHADVSAIAWIPFAHGWIYVIYLVTAIDLWLKMHWPISRLATLVLAGVVPVMSFIVEAKAHRQAVAKIAAAQAGLESRTQQTAN